MALFLLSFLLVTTSNAFAPFKPASFRPIVQLGGATKTEGAFEQKAFQEGTLIEFAEKKRSHIGKILQVERKSNGAIRYDIEEYPSKKLYSIADKEVSYSIPAPTNDNQVQKLLKQLEHAQAVSEEELRKEIDISAEILEMAWEEFVDDEEKGDISPKSLVELVHSHSASAIENYMAWRLLKAEVGHVFFKEIKEHGRVTSFKPKPAKYVEVAKANFCANHSDEEGFCHVPDDESTLRP